LQLSGLFPAIFRENPQKPAKNQEKTRKKQTKFWQSNKAGKTKA
jgi:hypothetical protein